MKIVFNINKEVKNKNIVFGKLFRATVVSRGTKSCNQPEFLNFVTMATKKIVIDILVLENYLGQLRFSWQQL